MFFTKNKIAAFWGKIGLDEKAVENMLKGLTDKLVKEMSAIDKDAEKATGSIKGLIETEVIGRLIAIEEHQVTTEKNVIKAIKEEFSALQKDEIVRKNLMDDIMAQLRGQHADDRSFLVSIQALCEQSAQNANRRYEQFRAWQEKRAQIYRKQLHEAAHEQNIKTGLVLRYAQQILEIIPNDVLANFYIFVSEHESESSAVNAYLYRLDVDAQEGETICEMLDYLIEPLEPRMKDALRYLADRAFQQRKFNRGKYEHYITAIEEGKSFDPLERWDLFIAYSSKDRQEVEKLVRELESQEIHCFVAYRDLPHGRGAGGENYWAMLKTAMGNSRGIVFVSTPNSRSMTCDAIQREDKTIDNGMGELPYFEATFGKDAKIRIEYRPGSDSNVSMTRSIERFLKRFFGDVDYCQTPAEVADEASRFLFPELYTQDETSTDPQPEPEPKPVVVSKSEPEPEPEPAPCSAVAPETERKVITYAGGDVYDGEVKYDQRNGHGVYRFADGDIYEGEFKDNLFNGHGALRLASGIVLEGEWKDDEFIEQYPQEQKETVNRQGYSPASTYPTLDNYDETEFEIEGTVLKKYKGKATEVKIPFGVTSIGRSAFWGCSSLTSIVIPDSVTSIDESAFSGCSSLTTIVIPDRVTSIGLCAFSGCSSLTSIVIPNAVISIGRLAFSGCSSLTSIVIPNAVISIGEAAFCGCDSLKSIEVAQGNLVYHSAGNCLIETKSKTMVAGCNTSIIPMDGSVTSIQGGVFSGYDLLKRIVIPDSVTLIAAGALECCNALESIEVAPGNPVYHSAGNCLIETKSKTLVAGCKTSIIPKDGSVTSIGDFAFCGCSSLESIVIPDSVTSIGDSAFYGCWSLTSIVIPDSVTYIGGYAFGGRNSLTIYCEAKKKPRTWSRDWNPDNRPVVWGYKK